MERFFVIAPPGFEAEAAEELREIWPLLLAPDARPHALPLPEIKLQKGGFEFVSAPFAALQLNFFLKTASRILWRLAEFKVRDFPKLHAKLERLDVAARLGHRDFNVKAAAGGSRLGNEKRVEETARAAWGLNPANEDIAVFIRLADDLCTVSLDTSGEHLHRRGLNLLRGEAPLRETAAAFCLRQMMKGVAVADLRSVTLTDPMCGSGTFLTEGLSLWGGHFQRSYRFQGFHGLPKLFRQPKFGLNYRLPKPVLTHFRGSDRDAKVLQAARENFAKAAEFFPGGDVELRQRDLFAVEAPTQPIPRHWVICNPPYGERLQGEEPARTVLKILEIERPERFGILWPAETHKALRWPKSLRRLSEHRFKNGGLDVVFSVHVNSVP